MAKMKNLTKFTEKHDAELKELFGALSFAKERLPARFGATGTLSPADLLDNTSIATLKEMSKRLNKEVSALQELDEWDDTNSTQAKASKTKRWQRFVSLLRGYKLDKAAVANAQAELKAEAIKEITLLENIQDAVRIDELKKMSSKDLGKKLAEAKAALNG